MKLSDFYFASKHAAGTKMPILLPDGSDSGEWLQVMGPDCDDSIAAAKDFIAAYRDILDSLKPLDAECREKGDWTRYNTELNSELAKLNDALAAVVVIGWSFDEKFTKKALVKLLKEYKGLGGAVAQHHAESRKELSVK